MLGFFRRPLVHRGRYIGLGPRRYVSFVNLINYAVFLHDELIYLLDLIRILKNVPRIEPATLLQH